MSLLRTFSLFIFSLFAVIAFAGSDTTNVNRKEIIVTAERMPTTARECPSAISVVDTNTLKSIPRGIAVDEALRLVPGVRIDNQADGERVHLSMRGQGILSERGIRGVQVLLDGLPLDDPSGFAPDLYDVDWGDVERVEVLRGPVAAVYGGASSGGIINITSENGGDNPIGYHLSSTAGSNAFRKSSGSIGGTIDRMNYRLLITQTEGNGYRDHSAFRGTNFSSKLNWMTSPNVHLTTILRWTNYFNENAEGLNIDQVAENPRQANPDAIPFNELQSTQRLTVGLSGEANVAENQLLDFSGYLRNTEYKEAVPSSVQHRKLVTPGATLQYNLLSGKGDIQNHFSIGSDLQYQSVDEYELMNMGGAREDTLLSNEIIQQTGIAAFLIDRLEVGKNWKLSGGLRFDQITNKLTDTKADSFDLSGSKNFSKVTARIGVTYTYSPLFNPYVTWGQGFLPPAIEELANNPDRFGGFNQHLTFATSQGEDIGVRGTYSDKFSYSVTAFQLNTDNDFGRYRITSRPLETFYGNMGTSSRFGLETEFSITLTTESSIQLAYTYSHFKYTAPDSLNNKSLPNSPEHQLSGQLSYAIGGKLTVGVGCDYQNRWYIDQQNSITVSGFTLVNASLMCPFEVSGMHCDVSVSGRNLFIRNYIAFTEPDPDGNSYQPGPKAEYFGKIGLKY